MTAKAVRALVKALEEEPIPKNVRDEKGFERNFLEPICVEYLSRARPKLEIAVHPWSNRAKTKQWADSKKWATVQTWGMKHTFDLAARDPHTGWSLAVEVKLAKARPGRSITGDFQRMMGQCYLARLRHDAVVGLFGYIGDLRASDEDERDYRQELRERHGIWIVVRKVG